MVDRNKQTKEWSGDFGKEYTDRNTMSVDELNKTYIKSFGISRTELNKRFLSEIDKSARILEVGSNTGNQLLCLQELGFNNLYGLELQDYAIEVAKTRTEGMHFSKGAASDIPFDDSYFDLVFTSGVLIHIHPSRIEAVLGEIYRCTKTYIWGFEYYADSYVEVAYRGQKNLLWKTDFADLYRSCFKDLRLLQEEQIERKESTNKDSMFLLIKNSTKEE